jgi:hypothetical protein
VRRAPLELRAPQPETEGAVREAGRTEGWFDSDGVVLPLLSSPGVRHCVLKVDDAIVKGFTSYCGAMARGTSRRREARRLGTSLSVSGVLSVRAVAFFVASGLVMATLPPLRAPSPILVLRCMPQEGSHRQLLGHPSCRM